MFAPGPGGVNPKPRKAIAWTLGRAHAIGEPRPGGYWFRTVRAMLISRVEKAPGTFSTCTV